MFDGNMSNSLCSGVAEDVPGIAAAGMIRASPGGISDSLLCVECGVEKSCVLCGVPLDPDGPTRRLGADDVTESGSWMGGAGEDETWPGTLYWGWSKLTMRLKSRQSPMNVSLTTTMWSCGSLSQGSALEKMGWGEKGGEMDREGCLRESPFS